MPVMLKVARHSIHQMCLTRTDQMGQPDEHVSTMREVLPVCGQVWCVYLHS